MMYLRGVQLYVSGDVTLGDASRRCTVRRLNGEKFGDVGRGWTNTSQSVRACVRVIVRARVHVWLVVPSYRYY